MNHCIELINKLTMALLLIKRVLRVLTSLDNSKGKLDLRTVQTGEHLD